MTKVRVAGFSISLDGFGAGPEQSLENPLGKRGLELHQWMFGTRMFRAMIGKDGGSDGGDEAYAHRLMDWLFAVIRAGHMVCAGLPADAPSARSDRDGKRHHLHLRGQRYRGGVGSGEASCQWSRR